MSDTNTEFDTLVDGLFTADVDSPYLSQTAEPDEVEESKFYREDQKRDKGRFADEGKGAKKNEIKPPKNEADLTRFISDVEASDRYKEVARRYAEQYGLTEDSTHWSRDKFSKDGVYTPERQAIHDKIVSGMLNPKAIAPEGTKPQFTLLMGVPGSGKTTAGVPIAKTFSGEASYINPDEAKEKLPEYEGWNAGALHEESQDIARNALDKAMAERHNILVDASGRHALRALRTLDGMAAKGYETNVVYVDVPLQVAAQRAWERYNLPGGRFTPLKYVATGVDHLPEQTYEKLKADPNLKRWAKVDNSGKTAKVIDKGER